MQSPKSSTDIGAQKDGTAQADQVSSGLGGLKGFSIILPGILIAATGIGAGDLATASFSGSQLGLAVLWAVVLGGVFKYVLTEGLMRWQLATGDTFLEGVYRYLGRSVIAIFILYLFCWSFFVGSALISANGVALYAIFPIFETAQQGKFVFGIASSILAFSLVLIGGFKLFEKIMSVCIGIMFITVCVTAMLLWPGTGEVLSGLFLPSIPDAGGEGISWTVALIGGVGGTVTILCYGYWIREKGRTDASMIPICRIDLFVGYLVTILFGVAMVIIGSTIETEGKGANLLISLADKLEEPLGLVGRWLFLVGAFGAVFSSLIGVMQAVPYLFTDVWMKFMSDQSKENTESEREKSGAIEITRSKPYYLYMAYIAFVPILGLVISFKEVQKFYSIIGAAFMPLVALALLYMNSQTRWLGENANGWLNKTVLIATLLFFSTIAGMKWL